MSSIDKPSHYASGKVETIEAIEDWDLGFHLGNVIKYCARAGKKNPHTLVEDLKKAHWYLERHILNLSGELPATKLPGQAEVKCRECGIYFMRFTSATCTAVCDACSKKFADMKNNIEVSK